MKIVLEKIRDDKGNLVDIKFVPMEMSKTFHKAIDSQSGKEIGGYVQIYKDVVLARFQDNEIDILDINELDLIDDD
jgi:hypothetical protein